MTELTKEELKPMFKEYNKAYFEGKLRMPVFKTYYSDGRTFGMYFFWSVNPKHRRNRREIWIASNVEWTEETLKDVLIHEMIHYKIDMDGGNPQRHGKQFKAICKEIYDKYGITSNLQGGPSFTGLEPIPASIGGKIKRFWNRYIL